MGLGLLAGFFIVIVGCSGRGSFVGSASVGSQRATVGSQRASVGSQRTTVGSHRASVGSQRARWYDNQWRERLESVVRQPGESEGR